MSNRRSNSLHQRPSRTVLSLPSCYIHPPLHLSKESLGLFLLVLSACFYSGMGCFMKLAANTTGGLASTQLVFFRATFQGILVLIAMFFYKDENSNNNNNSKDQDNDAILENHEQRYNNSAEEQLITQQPTQSAQNQWNQHPDHINRHRPLICVPFGTSQDMIQVVILRGIIGACGFILYFFSIKTLPLGDAITLVSLYPVFTVLFARIFLQESIPKSAIVATFLSFTGAALIAGPTLFLSEQTADNNQQSPQTTRNNLKIIGYITALTGSCFSAAVIVLIRACGKLGAHTLQLLFSWAFFATSLSILAGGWGLSMEGIPWKFSVLSCTTWYYILAMCCCGSMAHLLLNYAARIAPASLAGIMRATDVVWAYLLEIQFFQQVPSQMTVIGAIFILISPLIIAMQKIKDKQQLLEKSLACEQNVPLVASAGHSTPCRNANDCSIDIPSARNSNYHREMESNGCTNDDYGTIMQHQK